MKIVHYAPFSPNACGLYEAARDMTRADCEAGHTVYFVDTGVSRAGNREEAKAGQVDDRAGFKLMTVSHELIKQVNPDILFFHTDVYKHWYADFEAPIVWVVHGRPQACVTPEVFMNRNSYSTYINASSFPRTKKMLYFWDDFIPNWYSVFHGKDIIMPMVIDQHRFRPLKTSFSFKNKGQFNFLISDSDREDVSVYNLINNLNWATKSFIGTHSLKFHFCGGYSNIYNPLYENLRRNGFLGDIMTRVSNIELVYNAADCIISPNKILTRTIAEAVCCGTPVICQEDGKHSIADIYCNIDDHEDLEEALKMFINGDVCSKNERVERSKLLHMDNYNKNISKLYEEVLKK